MDFKKIAKRIVDQAFIGKTDRGGYPYIQHLYRVARPFRGDPVMYTIALLHDLLEDCPEWTENRLRGIFPNEVVDVVVILTKRPGESYMTYIQRIRTNVRATRIKIEDLTDNMDITRLPVLTDSDILRLRKYHTSYIYLHHENTDNFIVPAVGLSPGDGNQVIN